MVVAEGIGPRLGMPSQVVVLHKSPLRWCRRQVTTCESLKQPARPWHKCLSAPVLVNMRFVLGGFLR